MKHTWLIASLVVAVAGCTRTEAQISEGHALASAAPAAVATAGSSSPAGVGAAGAAESKPQFREVTLPAGTVLPVTLSSAVGSDTSRVEDPVRATVRRAVTVRGVQVVPAGTAVRGHVTHAERSARVKGRASIAFRFTQIDLPGPAGRASIASSTISRLAPATKKQDAMKIGGGAAGGAIVGGILGGGDGAAKGAAIGGGAGTAVVLATRGKEVRLAPGASLAVKLTAPLTLRVPVN
jgi:hypothetical protein